MERTENRRILDIIIIVLLFVLSAGIHKYYLMIAGGGITDVHSLLENSVIGGGSVEEVFYLPHMGAGVYRYVLRLLFFLVGNKPMTAVVLQAFLKLAGLFVLYFAMGLAVGRAGAFLTTVILLFFPPGFALLYQINPVYLTALVCSLLFLFLGGLLQGNRKQGFHRFGWFILFVFYGMLCGAAAFLDIAGAVLLAVSVLWIVLVDRHGDREGFRGGCLQAVCIFLGSVLAIVGLGCLMSVSYGLSFETPYISYLSHLEELWNGNYMEYFYLGLLLAAMAPGVIIQFGVNRYRAVKTAGGEREEVPDRDNAAEDTEDTVEEPPKTKPLDNPLPLPKKHERRTMDFVRQPDGKDMDFDILLKDEDDFDI